MQCSWSTRGECGGEGLGELSEVYIALYSNPFPFQCSLTKVKMEIGTVYLAMSGVSHYQRD